MEKITCITVCRNNKQGLLETVCSALAQTVPLYEMIIVDGASVDGTSDSFSNLEKQFQEKKVLTQFISEPDTGIYNAMNKGVRMASGEWLLFMNSGDKFADKNVLRDMMPVLQATKADVVYGNHKLVKKNGKIQICVAKPLSNLNKGMMACHQAIFTRSNIIKRRPYCEDFKIVADYEWYASLYRSGGTFEYCPVIVCQYQGGGVSKSYEAYVEHLTVREKLGIEKQGLLIEVKKKIFWIRYKILHLE